MANLGFGLQMTLVGMSLVFGVLALLWGTLAMLGRLDRADPVVATVAAVEPASAVAVLEADLLTAVTIAVVLHASSRRRQAAPEMRSTLPGSQIYASRWMAAGRTRQTRAWLPKR
jgi:Na+-transporting methylmalonyl-CoA/oxaloacetate decarboxylase gamma subunit